MTITPSTEQVAAAFARALSEVEEPIFCDVCHEQITGDWWHEPHDDGCPNQVWERAGDFFDAHPTVDCECNNRAHEECCPACAPHIIAQWRRLVLWYWSGTRAGWVAELGRAHLYENGFKARDARDRLVTEGRYNSLNRVEAVPVRVGEILHRRLTVALAACGSGRPIAVDEQWGI